jgi:putative membrane protein
MMMDGLGMTLWGVFSFLLGLLLIVLFIVALAAALKWVWGETRLFGRGNGETALEVLKKRYARGEISKEEYERIKKEIE